MTPEFKTALRRTGLSAKGFASVNHIGAETVTNWGKPYAWRCGIIQEPLWAWHLVKAWTAHPELLQAALVDAYNWKKTGD